MSDTLNELISDELPNYSSSLYHRFFRRRRPHHLATVHDLREMERNLLRLLRNINRNIYTVMDTTIQITEKLTKVSTQLDKVSAESTKNLQAVKDLQAIIDAGPAVSADLQAAVDKLEVQAQTLDDLTPDIPIPEPAPTAPLRSVRTP